MTPLFVRAACSLPALLAGAVLMAANPATAKVTKASDRGFVVRHVAEVPADADEAWAMLLRPAEWWDSAHTWSGDAANLSLDARAGGCFCEVLPNATSPRAAPRGGVEHMRVIYVEQPRALRMAGLLGPLQADAATGTMTVQLKPAADGGKTQILLEYVVGGYLRGPVDKTAAAVDGVLGQQLNHLAAKLGGDFAAAFSLPIGDAAGETPPAAPPPGVLPLADQPPEAGDRKAPAGR